MKINSFSFKSFGKQSFTIYPLIALGLMVMTNSHAAERDAYKHDGVTFSISVRTPEQIRAFYSARGFPEIAIRELESKCLLTVGIQNSRKDIVWLEPSNWRFTTEQGNNVRRISREEWDARWAKLTIPLASRATFGWTQLPESRDLLTGETAGGNIVIEPPKESFSVDVLFKTGSDKNGPDIRFKAENLQCSQPTPSGDK
ncbi:hypothetical protein [Sulfurirhabdus autotrophica]|uniref:Uncharacterized protein n=1 Tax=Sulfurirhabdus autotrophica TaxID=1706046 RepID=A0A4R3XYI4_9PROT|nr:hypothetical protein [Sulfurirhabdus autotrophica]TCV82874.1 hypothetical protein EDC63_1183 [Sulfurirhabdus autotrophica]